MLTTSEKEQLNNCSIDELLDSLSLGIMQDSIQTQIDDEVSTRDYLTIVSDKFDIIREGEFDTEIKDAIVQEINQFYLDVINKIVKKFGLSFDDTLTNVQEVAETLYNFFVIGRKRNVKEFISQYIDENVQEIAEYVNAGNSRDVMSISLSEGAVNKEFAAIAANIGTVIDYIIDMHIDTDTFLDTLAASEGDYYVCTMQEYIQNDIVNGDIPTEYMRGILDEYDGEYASELRNEFRVKFGMKGVGNI